jgi:PAS domain S-box-containing protein
VVRARRAQRRTPGAEQHAAEVLESIADPVVAFDRKWRCTYASSRAARAIGRERKKMLGRRLQELYPEHAASLTRACERALAGDASAPFEFFSPQSGRWLEAQTFAYRTGVSIQWRDITERKAMEEALRDSRARARHRLAELEALYESAPIGLAVLDTQFRFVRANRRIAQLAGLPVQSLLGRTPREVLPGVADRAEAGFRRVLDTREPLLNFEICGITPADPQKPLCANSWWTPLRDAEGRITAVSVAAEDITARKGTESALRENEKRFRTLADNIAQFAWMTDDAGGATWFNRRWYEYTGTTPEQMQDGGWHSVYHPDHIERVTGGFRRCCQTGEIWEDTYPLRGKDGSFRWFLSRAMPIRGDDGHILHWFGTSTDITERREMEERLRESQEQFQRLYNADIVGILSADMTTICDANNVFLRMIGYTREDLRAGRLRWRELTPPEYADTDQRAIQELLRSGSCKGAEKEYIRSDGRRVPVLIGAILLERSPFKVLCYVLDLTERKRLERRTLETEKLDSLGHLAAGVAHDFNNLLVGIMGSASLARDIVPEPHPVAELLERIVRSSERAAHLTRQLLAYTGQGRLFVEPVCVSEVAAEALALLGPSIPEGIAIRAELRNGLPAVMADRTQIRQVISDLLINAAEAIGRGPGAISISTDLRGTSLCVEVCDTGCGMDETTRSRIFDPFFTTKFMGRGLGLPAAYGTVRSHGGSISVASDAGRGSTFTVLLPVSERKDGQ